MTTVILDISRLISRIRHHTPSGVDRVEMAYARGLLERYGDKLHFAAVHPLGWKGRVPRNTALGYLDWLERCWLTGSGETRQRSIGSVLPALLRLRPRTSALQPGAEARVYIQVSPHHLTRPAAVKAMLASERASFLCMVHDLIPIEYPEYARESGARLHRLRMQTVADLADAVIVNSAATGRSFANFADASGRVPSIHVALLGTETLSQGKQAVAAGTDPADRAKPYFVCVGTIEPRKNHLLLLNIWRQMAETLPASEIPRLVIVGRRGWENEQVLDMLDRCAALRPHIEEINGCSDVRLAGIVRGARALLMPSFAEGFGMPVAEALNAQVPVICSDIAAHREVGGTAPDYLDPLDGPGWITMIRDHARAGQAFIAQRERLAQWQAPTWSAHLDIVDSAIDQLDRSAADR